MPPPIWGEVLCLKGHPLSCYLCLTLLFSLSPPPRKPLLWHSLPLPHLVSLQYARNTIPQPILYIYTLAVPSMKYTIQASSLHLSHKCYVHSPQPLNIQAGWVNRCHVSVCERESESERLGSVIPGGGRSAPGTAHAPLHRPSQGQVSRMQSEAAVTGPRGFSPALPPL